MKPRNSKSIVILRPKAEESKNRGSFGAELALISGFFASLRMTILVLCLTGIQVVEPIQASEVIEETNTRVMVREHPKTGKPYVSIISQDAPEGRDLFGERHKIRFRPDYRLLDPKVKSGEIPYDGPYSSSTKIYVFAATLATLGTAGGLVALAAAPAASGAAASGGGVYLAAGGAVAAGAAGTAAAATKSNPKQDDFTHVSKSHKVDDLMKKEGPTSTKVG